jgi:hypothetical protein
MSTQCNSCGAYDDVLFCPHCGTTAVCIRCAGNHKFVCEEIQKKKARGQGPTVIQHTYKSVLPDSVTPIDASLGAIKDLLKE